MLSDWSNGPRRDIAFPVFGDGIFIQEGKAWKRSRGMLRPQFSPRKYGNLGVFREPINDLLELFPSKGGIVDLQPLFFRFTLDVTTSFFFGDSIRSLRSPGTTGEHTFANPFDTAQKYVAKRFRLLDLYWFVGGKEFREACDRVHDFANRIIDRNLSPNTANEDAETPFLHSVAKDCPDRATLRGQIVNILAAGRDTTACLLSWTFFLLGRHPHVMEKLRADVFRFNSKRDKINRTDLRNMQYLQNVMKETLRLYPSVPVNTRTAAKTTVLPTGGGPDRKAPVLVPKGSAVAYSVYTLHRRPDLYGMDAEVFRPERWDEDMPLNHDPTSRKWGYLLFSGGPRVCLGLDFALTEAAYAIVRILQRYPTIKMPEGESMEITGFEKQTVTLVLQIKEGC